MDFLQCGVASCTILAWISCTHTLLKKRKVYWSLFGSSAGIARLRCTSFSLYFVGLTLCWNTAAQVEASDMGFCSNPLEKHHVGDQVNELGYVKLILLFRIVLNHYILLQWCHFVPLLMPLLCCTSRLVRLIIGILYALMAVLTVFWIHLQGT